MYINYHETRLTSYQRHGLAVFLKISYRSLTHFFAATVLMAKSKYAYSAYGTFSEWTRYMYVLPASIPLFTSRIFSSTLSPMSRRKYSIFFTYKQCSGSESESGSNGSTCFWASRIRIHQSEVWIRIRILLSSCKSSKKNLDPYYFVTLFDFLSGSGSRFRIRTH